MRTKAYHAFEQKIFYFDDDIDLVEVIRVSIIKGDLTELGSKFALKNVDPEKHKHIKRRRNSDGSRELLANHLRQTVYSSYIKDVYEEVTEYLRLMLEQAAENGFDAGRLIGEHSTKFDAKLLLAAGTWEAVARMVADSVFQSLEAEKSTLRLLEKTSSKLALGVDRALIDAALPYLEVRHFLVHADGKLPREFARSNPCIPAKQGYVKLNYQFVTDFRDAVKALVRHYDEKVVAANLLDQKWLHVETPKGNPN